jgi:hypothetical protein
MRGRLLLGVTGMGAIGAVLGLWAGRVVLAQPVGIALALAAGGAVALTVTGIAGAVGWHALRARVRRQTGVSILQADSYGVAVDPRLAPAACRLLSVLHHGSEERGCAAPSNRPRSDPAPGAAADDSIIDRGGQPP